MCAAVVGTVQRCVGLRNTGWRWIEFSTTFTQ
jgi:hypothetical protein